MKDRSNWVQGNQIFESLQSMLLDRGAPNVDIAGNERSETPYLDLDLRRELGKRGKVVVSALLTSIE